MRTRVFFFFPPKCSKFSLDFKNAKNVIEMQQNVFLLLRKYSQSAVNMNKLTTDYEYSSSSYFKLVSTSNSAQITNLLLRGQQYISVVHKIFHIYTPKNLGSVLFNKNNIYHNKLQPSPNFNKWIFVTLQFCIMGILTKATRLHLTEAFCNFKDVDNMRQFYHQKYRSLATVNEETFQNQLQTKQ